MTQDFRGKLTREQLEEKILASARSYVRNEPEYSMPGLESEFYFGIRWTLKKLNRWQLLHLAEEETPPENRIIYRHVDEEAAKVNDLEWGGWSFDTLVFWNDVWSVEKSDGASFLEAYDAVAARYSFLKPSDELLGAQKRDTP